MEIKETDFEKIASNADIVVYIYQLLKFSDQLSLSQVCVTLQEIFKKLIWTDTYGSMIVVKRLPTVVILNALRTKRLVLELEEFGEYLQVYAANVQQLTEVSGKCIDYTNFKNLTTMTLNGVALSEYNFEIMADNCPLLEKMHLNCCKDEHDKQSIMIGKNWRVMDLLKMKNLQSLTIASHDHIRLLYKDFLQIVCELVKLECLRVTATIRADETVLKPKGNGLQELQIVTNFEAWQWPTNFKSYLHNFESLKVLNIRILPSVNDEVLATIASTCKNLEKFHVCLTKFRSIICFALAPKVCELSLNRCEGLSYDNLRELLSQRSITKFSSQETHYEGVFEDFRPRSSIQSLQVDAIDMLHFKSAYVGNDALKELYWCGEAVRANDIPLQSCKNLEILGITKGYIATCPTLVHFKRLRKLTISGNTRHLRWSDITAALKHPSLEELKIADNSWCLAQKYKPLEAFTVNLNTLKVNLTLFEPSIDFWMDVFRQNTNLKLIVYCCNADSMDCVRPIVNHEYFPRDIRTIDICGFKLNCQGLRRNYNAIMRAFRSVVYYEYVREFFHITLARN